MRRWEAMPDLKHAELIEGIVHMASPLSLQHDETHYDLTVVTGFYITNTKGCGGGLEGTWLMGQHDVPQPDLTVRILPNYGGQWRVEGEYAAGAPEMVIEVAISSRSRDFGSKLRLFERMGVREYLIALPRKRQIH